MEQSLFSVDLNFHVLVIILTMIIYIVFKKRAQNKKSKKFTNYIYILVPIVLYGGNYLLKEKENIKSEASSVSSILKTPYPLSESSSSSSSSNLLSDN